LLTQEIRPRSSKREEREREREREGERENKVVRNAKRKKRDTLSRYARYRKGVKLDVVALDR